MVSDLTRTLVVLAVVIFAPSLAVAQQGAAFAEAEDAEADTFDVVVESSGPQITSSERTVGSETLRNTPKRTAGELLRLVPGMVLVQHGSEGKGHQFYIRGFDAVHGSDVEVLLDGIPLNELSNVHGQGYLDLAFIIPEVVQRLKVIKGSTRLGQGNFATAGTVEYQLGVPRPERGARLTWEVGTTGRQRLMALWAPRTTAEDTFAAIEAVQDEGFGTNRQIQRLSGMARARLWRSASGLELDLLAGGYAGRFGLPGTLRLDDVRAGQKGFYDAYTTDTEGISGRGYGALQLKVPVSEGRAQVMAYSGWRHLTLDENFTGFLLSPEQGDRHLQRQETFSGGLKLDVSRRLTPTLTLTVLGHFHTEGIRQSDRQLDTAGLPLALRRQLDILQQYGAGGLGVRWSPLNWLMLDAGLRADAFRFEVDDPLNGQRGSQTLPALSPRLALVGFAGDDWTLFAAGGRGVRAPEARAVLSSPPVGDEDAQLFEGGQSRITASTTAELGARWAPEGPMAAGVTAFFIGIDRESIFDHVSGFNLELAGTRRLGAEFEAQWRPLGWLKVIADLTLVDGHFESSGNPIPGAPAWMGTVRTIAVERDTGLSGGLHITHLGQRALAHGATAGAATVLDLSASWQWRWLRLDLSVENLLDTRWREGEYHFASSWDPSQPTSQIPSIHFIAAEPLTARLGLSASF